MMNVEEQKEFLREVDARFMRMLPGYPWLPCPICHGTEGCDHTVPERMRAAGANWHSSEKPQ
jgi:hypothetical protein